VPLVTVKRYVKLYRAGGPRAFFAAPSRRRGSKLTPELLVEAAQALLDEGLEVPDAARCLGMLTNTLHKAIRAGRLHKRVKKKIKAGGRLMALHGQRVSAA
jgi:hypothetical protein